MTLLAHHLDIDGRLGHVQEVVPDRANGTCLLAVHTAGQSGVQWRDVLSELGDLGYRVLVPDLPGHGHSEPAPEGPVTDLDEYAAWLVRVLDLLAAENTVVVGCSIGGKVAQSLAVTYGDQLLGAVSMCAEAGPGKGKLSALRRELEDSAAAARSDRTHLGTRAVIGRKVSRERAALIARMHCREDPEVSNSDLIAWCRHDVRERLADVGCPMTFVAGEDDLWVDSQAVAWAATQVPDADYVFLDGYGHYPMEEIDGFGSLLDSWVTKLGKDTP